MELKEACLKINGKQAVKSKSGSIKFKHHFKQLAVSFKTYTDFESVLKGIRSSDVNSTSYTKQYQKQTPSSFAYKVDSVDDKFSKPVVLYRGKKNAINRFIEVIIEEYGYCKKRIKKHCNKNLV